MRQRFRRGGCEEAASNSNSRALAANRHLRLFLHATVKFDARRNAVGVLRVG